MKKLLFTLLASLWFSAGPVWGQVTPNVCFDQSLSTATRTLLVRPGSTSGDMSAFSTVRFSYRTTGSPTGVSISIEAGNELAATQTPFEMIAALTDTSGASLGTAAGPWRYWFANVATLSGGTSPTIILTSCFTYGTVSIARFATVPTFPNQSANTVFSGPASGGAATPTFRSLVLADLPEGTANQFYKTNAAATALEHVTLGVGTAGTDFAIAHAAGTTTFNLPDASATARGVLTTGTQTLAGAKTFSSAPTFSTMTPGSVLFTGTGGLVSQDNANFFFDDTANVLAVGVNSLLNVRTTIASINPAEAALAIRHQRNTVDGDFTSIVFEGTDGATLGRIDNIRNATDTSLDLRFLTVNFGASAVERVRFSGDTGNVGIGTASPGTSRLKVAGGPVTQPDFATFVDQDATPAVTGGNLFKTVNTVATTVTAFDGDVNGQQFCIVFGDALTTITDGGTIFLQGAGNFTSTANDTMCLISDGTNNFELSRSVN